MRRRRFYFEELGLEPSEEMLERFRQMREKIHYNASVITDIKQGLQENEEKTALTSAAILVLWTATILSRRMAGKAGSRLS